MQLTVPSAFLKRVSFDTFDNKDASDFSLTLKSKHRDYSYSRRSRTFLCGTDQNDYSEFALEWLIDELVDDGDEIVCLRVVDKDSKISSDAALQERLYRKEARKLLDQIIDKNEDEKAISIILEFAVGKVHETIQRMVRQPLPSPALPSPPFPLPPPLPSPPPPRPPLRPNICRQIHIYEPVILIVGTRGRSLGGLQGLLPGSVSKYCLQHSPVPVIVVRPSSKRDKKKAKRRADPGRRVYQDILQSTGSPLHDPNSLSGAAEVASSASLNSSLDDPNNGGGSSSSNSGGGEGGALPKAIASALSFDSETPSFSPYQGSLADVSLVGASNSSPNASLRTSTEKDGGKQAG